MVSVTIRTVEQVLLKTPVETQIGKVNKKKVEILRMICIASELTSTTKNK